MIERWTLYLTIAIRRCFFRILGTYKEGNKFKKGSKSRNNKDKEERNTAMSSIISSVQL